MDYHSPRTPGSTPGRDFEWARMTSATPSPSPRHSWFPESTPRRSATRAGHTRAASHSQQSSYTPRPVRESPRYNSQGEYATVDVSAYEFGGSSRRLFHSSPANGHGHGHAGQHRRRASYTAHVRSSTPHGQSDEDEIIETLNGPFVLPAQARATSHGYRHAAGTIDGGWYADYDGYVQDPTQYYYPYDYAYPSYAPSPHGVTPRRASAASHQSPRTAQSPRVQVHQDTRAEPSTPKARAPSGQPRARRASTSTPQRSATARPASSRKEKEDDMHPRGPARKATEADAKLHQIPKGFSLKNWDPREEPILLLGSVFDPNSLGKWIYDWTVYSEGAGTPISEIAGDLWLLLLQLAGKIQKAEVMMTKIRNREDKDVMRGYVTAGQRLMKRLRSLLKSCEAPMLKVAKKSSSGLGKNSGVEFVDTLFGVDRQGPETDELMQSIRLFNVRFDANCEDLVQGRTQ